MKNITQITHTGDFCAGMSEYCDAPRCKGSYLADDAEILLNAKIPVLTVKHKTAELSGVPQANREIVLLQENENERVFRALLQKGELPIMMFQPK